MKIIAKFAFVLLVGVFVVFGGSTSAKADEVCNAACQACMPACASAMSSCIGNCTRPPYYGLGPIVNGYNYGQACINQCYANMNQCKTGCGYPY